MWRFFAVFLQLADKSNTRRQGFIFFLIDFNVKLRLISEYNNVPTELHTAYTTHLYHGNLGGFLHGR